MMNTKEVLIGQHRSLFGTEEYILAAPGRINIIGEHTDYNQGLVLPYALNRHIYMAWSTGEDRILVYSLDYRQFMDLSEIPVFHGWMNYFFQAKELFLRKFGEVPPLHITIASDLPSGAGVSSSSALTCGIIFLFQHALGLSLDREEMIRLAVEVEHGTGVRGGTMDQTTILCAKKNYAVKLDFKKNTKTFVPVNFGDFTPWLIHSGISHSLVHSDYNQRRRECEESVWRISSEYRPIKSLSDLNPDDLNYLNLPEMLFRRTSFVVKENERVNQAFDCLHGNNIESLGQLLYQSHEGLSKLYEVSTPEIDYFIESLKNKGEVAGARMIGGGFGGSILALIRKGSDVLDDVVWQYNQKFNKKAFFIEAESSQALEIIQ
ncbi:MAG TPA: galactokinase family protein [Saprospiraceae bacterium]|nr:galactokinase family protein [Saprospiraceae bacterium]